MPLQHFPERWLNQLATHASRHVNKFSDNSPARRASAACIQIVTHDWFMEFIWFWRNRKQKSTADEDNGGAEAKKGFDSNYDDSTN